MKTHLSMGGSIFPCMLPVAVLLTGFLPVTSQAQTSEPTRPLPRGPVEVNSGQVLSGTTGSMSGRRSAPAEFQGESPTEKWWNGKGLLAGSGNPAFDARSSVAARESSPGCVLHLSLRWAEPLVRDRAPYE